MVLDAGVAGYLSPGRATFHSEGVQRSETPRSIPIKQYISPLWATHKKTNNPYVAHKGL